MRKITALLLMMALIGSSFSVSLAEDYRDQVLPLLAEKLQVSPDTINLDGHLVELPLSGKQLWMGRYYTGEMAADTPLDDDPDTPVSPDEILAGVVYLDVSTGELLSGEEAGAYFAEEDKLLQAELERLAAQSGKIDPYFYGKILEVAPGDLFKVIIWLRYQETASMKEAMDEIIKDYPDLVEKGLVPPELAGGRLPLLEPRACIDCGEGGGVSGAEAGATGETAGTPMNEAAVEEEFQILPYPGPEILPLPEDKGGEDPAPADDIDWARYEEMMNRLAKVQAQGYAASLAALEQALDQMGVAFEVMENNSAVLCALTAEQLQSLKEAEYVESISEDAPVYALDGAAERAAAVLDSAGGVEERPAVSPWLLALALLLLAGGGGLYYRQRKKRYSAGESHV
mgnify:CR=1 FL=1